MEGDLILRNLICSLTIIVVMLAFLLTGGVAQSDYFDPCTYSQGEYVPIEGVADSINDYFDDGILLEDVVSVINYYFNQTPCNDTSVGGITIILKCDDKGNCVEGIPDIVREGILMVGTDLLDFLSDWTVEIYPEGYDPYGQGAKGRAFSSKKLQIMEYRYSLIIHEFGHALDFSSGFPSMGEPFGTIQDYYDDSQRYNYRQWWATYFTYLYGLKPMRYGSPSEELTEWFCEYRQMICDYMQPRIDDPWRYNE